MAKRKVREATVEPTVDLDSVINETELLPIEEGKTEEVVTPIIDATTGEPIVLVDDDMTPEDEFQPVDVIPSNTFKHREAWLHAAVEQITTKLFEPVYEVPANIRVSCGFPSRNALNGVAKQALGQCWADEKSADKHFEIFISPVIGDEMTALAILGHELCHAVVGIDAKHGPLFKAAATTIGLEGKMTSTVAGEKFREAAIDIVDILGPYPHAALDARKMTNGVKKQTTRLLKAECENCGYTVRVTRSWLDQVGAPHCPLHGEMNIHY